MRFRAVATLVLVSACGGSVEVAGLGSNPGGGGAGGAGSGGAGSGGAGGSAAAGGDDVPWTHDPGRTFSQATCEADGMQLYVELWPSGEACVGEPDVDPADVLALGISRWDGEPGTYAIGEETVHGIAHAGGVGYGEIDGTITMEPFAATPRWLSWQLSVGEGRTDLGPCGHFDDYGCEGQP
jgi:hypothetical protein